MKVRAHVFIFGLVQGVFFRVETKRIADRNHVMGWVHNAADGKVEAVFEGEEEAVRAMLDFCKKGPPAAKVGKVSVAWETYTGTFDDFEVR